MNPKHEVRVSTKGSDREIAKAYSRMERHAGKGDAPRSIFSEAFRTNFDRINWNKPSSLFDKEGRYRENMGDIPPRRRQPIFRRRTS